MPERDTITTAPPEPGKVLPEGTTLTLLFHAGKPTPEITKSITAHEALRKQAEQKR